MNKAELKGKWHKYCDTDKLVDDVMELLSRHNWKNSEMGVCDMLDEYFTNKNELLDLFEQSNHYIGNMRICFDIELERYAQRNEVNDFIDFFTNKMCQWRSFYSYTDKNGKTKNDYLSTGLSFVNAKDLLKNELCKQLDAANAWQTEFDSNGVTYDSMNRFVALCDMLNNFRANPGSTLCETLAKRASEAYVPVQLTAGMKTSRAFNKVCTTYGVDKLNPTAEQNADGTTRIVYPYDKLFAQYADLVSGLKRKLKFFMSLNPIDYLTMSFGVSWESCQSIKMRKQSTGGTLSYMLDGVSIITYACDGMPSDFTDDIKIYRNMIHYENKAFVQGRVYPQANDGNLDLYEKFRGFVQEELAELLGVENKWESPYSEHKINTAGCHYPDYDYHSECKAYSDNTNDNIFITIGHGRICPNCGRGESQYVSKYTLNCEHCDKSEEQNNENF